MTDNLDDRNSEKRSLSVTVFAEATLLPTVVDFMGNTARSSD